MAKINTLGLLGIKDFALRSIVRAVLAKPCTRDRMASILRRGSEHEIRKYAKWLFTEKCDEVRQADFIVDLFDRDAATLGEYWGNNGAYLVLNGIAVRAGGYLNGFDPTQSRYEYEITDGERAGFYAAKYTGTAKHSVEIYDIEEYIDDKGVERTRNIPVPIICEITFETDPERYRKGDSDFVGSANATVAVDGVTVSANLTNIMEPGRPANFGAKLDDILKGLGSEATKKLDPIESSASAIDAFLISGSQGRRGTNGQRYSLAQFAFTEPEPWPTGEIYSVDTRYFTVPGIENPISEFVSGLLSDLVFEYPGFHSESLTINGKSITKALAGSANSAQTLFSYISPAAPTGPPSAGIIVRATKEYTSYGSRTRVLSGNIKNRGYGYGETLLNEIIDEYDGDYNHSGVENFMYYTWDDGTDVYPFRVQYRVLGRYSDNYLAEKGYQPDGVNFYSFQTTRTLSARVRQFRVSAEFRGRYSDVGRQTSLQYGTNTIRIETFPEDKLCRVEVNGEAYEREYTPKQTAFTFTQSGLGFDDFMDLDLPFSGIKKLKMWRSDIPEPPDESGFGRYRENTDRFVYDDEYHYTEDGEEIYNPNIFEEREAEKEKEDNEQDDPVIIFD